MARVTIIGAGLAGLSAAITLAEHGRHCRLVSLQPSERAQSVLAEGGINAALDTMGEGDTTREHFEDTMAGGAWLADAEAVRGLTEHAPGIVEWLGGLGVPFHREGGKLVLRSFGGQRKKRTAYVKSSTGKVIVSALIDEARKYEARGLIERYPHHEFIRLLFREELPDGNYAVISEPDRFGGELGGHGMPEKHAGNAAVQAAGEYHEGNAAVQAASVEHERNVAAQSTPEGHGGSVAAQAVPEGYVGNISAHAGQEWHSVNEVQLGAEDYAVREGGGKSSGNSWSGIGERGARPLNAVASDVCGVRVRDVHGGGLLDLEGPVILASGGMNGIFPGRTTGTTANSGDVTAIAHAQGVELANLEMIQYHPTTIGISGKRCLISEAARGEGGRLYVSRMGVPWYFMEEKYPELGNLMPRDVVSREMFQVVRREDCGDQVYLDMTGLSDRTWRTKLPDLREEILRYLSIDPAMKPIPVSPGIHYFMGGIRVDLFHRTNLGGLYAAGECACQYHGANRLGGNSMLGAIYGGRVAAEQVLREWKRLTASGSGESSSEERREAAVESGKQEAQHRMKEKLHGSNRMQATGAVSGGSEEKNLGTPEGSSGAGKLRSTVADPYGPEASGAFNRRLGELLAEGMGIVRNEETLLKALDAVQTLGREAKNKREQARLLLAEEMLTSALKRRESLGAHYREDE